MGGPSHDLRRPRLALVSRVQPLTPTGTIEPIRARLRARSGLDLRRDIVKTRPSSCTHTPATSHTTQPATLPTGQRLAQAEKPNPACKAASPAPSLKPSAAHGQIGRSSAEFARGGSSDQPRPQWAFGSDESTHQLSSIAQVHAMAAGCFHRLSAQPHRDAPPRAQSFPRP